MLEGLSAGRPIRSDLRGRVRHWPLDSVPGDPVVEGVSSSPLSDGPGGVDSCGASELFLSSLFT